MFLFLNLLWSFSQAVPHLHINSHSTPGHSIYSRQIASVLPPEHPWKVMPADSNFLYEKNPDEIWNKFTSLLSGYGEDLLNPEYRITNPRSLYLYALDMHRKIFEKAHPRLQLINQSVDSLHDILLAYKSENKEKLDQQTKNYLELIIERAQYIDFESRLNRGFYKRPEKVRKRNQSKSDSIEFVNDISGEFIVNGVNQNRLAINNGKGKILFNVFKISKLDQFTFADSVQLLLHEASHSIGNVSLDFKDQISTKVSDWVRSKTTELKLNGNKKLISINLGKSLSLDESAHNIPIYVNDSHDLNEMWVSAVSRKFILLVEDSKSLKHYEDFYARLPELEAEYMNTKSVLDGTYKNSEMKYPERESWIWPVLSFAQPRLNSIGNVIIDFVQNGQFYGYTMLYRDQQNHLNQVVPIEQSFKHQYVTPPQLVDRQFRFEIAGDLKDFELQKQFGKDIINSSFEIYKTSILKNKKYFSVRVKSETLKPSDVVNLKLIARSEKTGQVYSLTPITHRFTSDSELLIHFKSADVDLVLNHISVSKTESIQGEKKNTSEVYTDNIIRPSGPIKIKSVITAESKTSAIKSLQIFTKKMSESFGSEFVTNELVLALDTTEKVKSVTLEIDRLTTVGGIGFNVKASSQKNLYYSDIAYLSFTSLRQPEKIFFNLNQSKLNEPVVLKLPFTEKTHRYEVADESSSNGSNTVTPSKDNFTQIITHVWVYLESGQVIRQNVSKLNLAYSHIQKFEFNQSGPYLKDETLKQENKLPTVLRCKNLF